jgi:hypothetical protein
LVSILADALTGVSPGRRLTAERASQNVVAVARGAPPTDPDPVRLIITANYDAGRVGLVYRDSLRRASAAVRGAARGFTPGWLGWLSLTIVWLLVLAILRVEGHTSQTIGAIQLPPTVVLVFALAALLELATADPGPAAGDNGSGAAVAVDLVRALDAAAPRHVVPELVLQGAGDGAGIGLRRYLRARRAERTAANTVVLGIAACTEGQPRWWTSDGSLVALRYSRQLVRLCAQVAQAEPRITAAPHPGRGSAPALPARLLRRPSISVGCVDPHGVVPRSHRREDVAASVDPSALEQSVQFALLLVDEIDAWLAESRRIQTVTRA